jgi:predicted RNase H-like nuclease
MVAVARTARSKKEGQVVYPQVLDGLIDAAWTLLQPSGVAVATETSTGWHLIGAAASYQHFLALADTGLAREAHPCGSTPQADKLLAAALILLGQRVDLVAIDMPLSHVPITGRGTSDNAVSRAYGARKCGTHTPSVLRPGSISDDLQASFTTCGYPLQTLEINTPGLIEVYPHPALVELASAQERLPSPVKANA